MYQAMLETFLQNELCHHQLNFLWFQQHGATAHTAQISMHVRRIIYTLLLQQMNQLVKTLHIQLRHPDMFQCIIAIIRGAVIKSLLKI